MYIVADIGGTKTRIAASTTGESFDEPVMFDSPKDDDELLSRIVDTIAALSAGSPMKGVVIGKPLWKRRASFESDLQERVPVPIRFVNDTALVGLGEAHSGAGNGSPIFVYITVSTGVNGVRIVDGKIDVSTEGFEIGGQYLATEGTTSWEEMISGSAIHKRFGVHPKELGKEHAVWEELAKIIAYGLHNTILHWSPDCVAFGGSMFNEIGISVDRVRFHLDSIMKKFPVLPEIVHSELGEVGGLWGGLALLRQPQ